MNSLTWAVVMVAAVSQNAGKDKRRETWMPHDAVRAAAADLATISIPEQPHCWYLWVREPSDLNKDAYTYALNTATAPARAGYPLPAFELYEGRLIRLDLRDWIPLDEDRKRFEQTISTYIDPNFYVESGSIQDVAPFNPALFFALPGITPLWPPQLAPTNETSQTHTLIRTKPYIRDGKRFSSAWVRNSSLQRAKRTAGAAGGASEKAGKSVPQFAPAIVSLAPNETAFLSSYRRVPIVEANRWLFASLSTVDYITEGLYYKLQGFEGLNQQQWLDVWGADPFGDAKKASEFIGMWRSGVTRAPRRGVFGIGRNISQSRSYPLVVVTQDLAEGSFDPKKHPIYSLGDSFKFDAVEALAMKSNGFVASALFNGEGALQDEAPQNIVSDRTVPQGPTRLQSGISCIRCHANHDMWQPMENHVQKLLGGGNGHRLYAIAELGGKEKDNAKQLVEIAEKYGGDLTTPLQLARDSHHRSVFSVTRRSAKECALAVSEVYNQFAYTVVTPRQACLELGVSVTDAEAAEMFLQLVPPINGTLEDPGIETIRGYDPDSPLYGTDRATWEANFQATYSRSLATRKLIKGDTE